MTVNVTQTIEQTDALAELLDELQAVLPDKNTLPRQLQSTVSNLDKALGELETEDVQKQLLGKNRAKSALSKLGEFCAKSGKWAWENQDKIASLAEKALNAFG